MWRRGKDALSLASQLLREARPFSSALAGSTNLLASSSNQSSVGGISSLRCIASWSSARGFSSSSAAHDGPPDGKYVALNDLRDNPGAVKTGRRVGRGIGSSKGKTAGRGHKGQRARSGGGTKPGFEGGQTPLRLRVPKRGFHNPFTRVYHPLNLDRLKEWIVAGRLDPSEVLNMKDLRDSGAVRRQVKDGVKVLARGVENFDVPVHLQVSQVSQSAREAIEKAGGSVKTVYYNKLGLRALLMPEWFEKKGRLLPQAARPPPKLAPKFEAIGELPPTKESLKVDAA